MNNGNAHRKDENGGYVLILLVAIGALLTSVVSSLPWVVSVPIAFLTGAGAWVHYTYKCHRRHTPRA